MSRQKGVWILPTVRMDPKIATLWAATVCSQVFVGRNIPCSITSWYREGDVDGLHGYHAGVDLDANIPVNEGILVGIADATRDMLGGKNGPFQVIYHDGHIHIEYDPTRTGVKPYKLKAEKEPCHSKSTEKSVATASKRSAKKSKASGPRVVQGKPK